MPKKKKVNYIYSLGRRKSAVARVRLFRGKGVSTVNNKPLDEYFTGPAYEDLRVRPFKVVDASDDYYTTVKVVGGGKRSQLDAVVHGVSRALAKADRDNFRRPLKSAGLLTRDARVRERRKVGTGGKARRKKQSPKR